MLAQSIGGSGEKTNKENSSLFSGCSTAIFHLAAFVSLTLTHAPKTRAVGGKCYTVHVVI